METDKKITKNIMHWRVIYHLFSGILFFSLGIFIFVRGKGFLHFLNTGLFGVLLAGFGVYRIMTFVHRLKKLKGDNE